MNQELIMMLNGDQAVHLSADAANDVTADGMIAAFYNEMQQSIQTDANGHQVVVIDESQNIVASNFSSFKDFENFKVVDNSAIVPDGITNSTEMVSNGVSGENLIIMDDGTAVSLADDSYLKSKDDDLTDSLKLGLMETNGLIPDNAEIADNTEPEKHSFHFWECSKCSALFNDPNACQLHLTTAHDFTCGLCSEPFQEKVDLENHIIMHISEVPGHELQMIAKPSVNIAQLPVTEDVNTEENPTEHSSSVPEITEEVAFMCSICGLSFQSSQNLQEHEKIHADEDSSVNSPDISHASIPTTPSPKAESESNLKPSTPSLKTESESKAATPLIKTESESNLKVHGRFSCDICDIVCYTKSSLLLHLNKKHRDRKTKNFSCDECGQSFQWKLSLENHLIIQHNRKKRCLSCSTCDEIFSSVKALNEHKLTHENNLLLCDTCGQKFQQSAGLLNHIKMKHPDVREHQCKECDKRFKVKQFLEAHVSEVHPERESNKCNVCLKAFMTSDSLANHIHAHHSGKLERYPCEICNVAFSSVQERYEHMTVHVAEIKNFQCELCDEAFYNQKDLTAHEAIHTGFID